MAKKLNEAQIIAGIKQGDHRAFDALFNEFYQALCYFADGLTGNKEDAKDIVVDIFCKFWSMRENFETIANIKAFLYISTRNQCFNFLKYQQRKTSREQEFLYLVTAENEEDAEIKRVHAEVLRELYKEIENLPSKCRKIFQLSMEGHSINQIALQMGISEENVRNQKKRAKKLLRIALLKKKLLVLIVFASQLQSHKNPFL